MSSYRRFISYMHQYPNGKKGNNCGFVKIEVKNNICSLLFQLKKVPSADTVSIVFFIRENHTITLVPIWEGNCPDGTFQQQLTTDSLHLFNTNYSFRQCGGIILRQENHVICGSCWDSVGTVPVDLVNTNVNIKPSAQHPNNKTLNETVSLSSDNTFTSDANSNRDNSSNSDTYSSSDNHSNSNNISNSNNNPKSDNNSKSDNGSKSNNISKSDNDYNSNNHSIQASTVNGNDADISSETTDNTDLGTTPHTAADIRIETNPRDTSDTFFNAASDTSSDEKNEEQKNPPTFEELWNSMQKKYPPLDPFEEGEIVEGMKISPSDLPYLQCLPFDIGANRFLLHGYKNYKHLLIGRMEGQNRYILGIPGVFDSQEQFMAKMFGFPCFKPIRSCMKPVGQFGYWFRCIHS